jgi:DNA invertase Pin-like site-specific DNA recombinase
MTTTAGVWVRVSTGGQDEANQVPEIERHCASHGYSVTRRYELNDKSASKGAHQTKLDQMLHDMRDGTIKVLVCWHSDRLERRGPEYVFRLLTQVRDAGGHVESVQEPLFGGEDISGEALTALGAVIAHQYTVHLSEQVTLAHDRIRANGGVGPGGTPWGFRVTGSKYEKTLVATDVCCEYVPQIFARCIAGESCRDIAMWLDAEGVPPKRGDKWHEGTVRKLIHNRVYAGRWQDEGKTKTIAYCEPVVSADTWDRANEALSNRPKRGPVNEDNRPMLANLKCARCEDSPMYRIRLKSRSGKFYYYYRCAGRGPQRKGCGNMVPYDLTQQIVHAIITLMSDEPYGVRHWVEGTNWDAEISNVKQDMREAVEAEDFGRLPELRTKLAELRSREVTKGHWEYEDTGITVGEYFHSLDYDDQREYLKTHDIRAEKAPKLDGLPGVRLVIDGRDYGVNRDVAEPAANEEKRPRERSSSCL